MIDGILDTTIVIDLLRQNLRAMQWFSHMQNQNMRLAITPIVWLETIQGAQNKAELAQIMRFLKQFRIIHTNESDHNWAMRQFARFYLSHGMDFTDVLIASVAIRLAVPLYTLNLKHYQPLPGVSVQRPY